MACKHTVPNRMYELGRALRDIGLSTLRTEEEDEDSDAAVYVTENISIQVCQDGTYSVHMTWGEGEEWTMYSLDNFQTDIGAAAAARDFVLAFNAFKAWGESVHARPDLRAADACRELVPDYTRMNPTRKGIVEQAFRALTGL